MIDTNPIHAEQKNSPVDHTDRRICIYFKYTQLMQSMRHPSPLTSVPKPFCIRPQILWANYILNKKSTPYAYFAYGVLLYKNGF